MAPRVGVLGGGISGLAAAYRLLAPHQPASTHVSLLEAGRRLGGCIQTTQLDSGEVLEHGPRSLRPVGAAGRATIELAADLGLGDRVVAAEKGHPGAKNRFIFAGGQLQQVPSTPLALLRGALFPATPRKINLARIVLQAVLLEPFRARRDYTASDGDESIHSFVARRLGQEAADFLIDPVCLGIFSGDARTLSVRACFPILPELEAKYGSLILGQLRHQTAPLDKPSAGHEALVKRLTGRPIWSLRGGLEELVRALIGNLAARPGFEAAVGQPVQAISLSDEGGVRVELAGGETHAFDRALSCLPANALASAVWDADPRLGDLLSEIPFHSICVVNLVYPHGALGPVGFGYLVPTHEHSDLLGVVFDSCTFAEQDGEVGTRMTAMIGGFKFKQLFGSRDVSDDELVEMAQCGIRDQLGIGEKPLVSNVTVWRDCMPQYTVGHPERVRRIEERLMQGPFKGRLAVAGNSFRGVGVNDCILNAQAAAEALMAR